MWRKLPCSFAELNLDVTLGGGQSFRWTKNANNEWKGVYSGVVWIFKQDTVGNILYRVLNSEETRFAAHSSTSTKRQKVLLDQVTKNKAVGNKILNYEEMLLEYFNLQFKLEDLYALWSKVDANFKAVSKKFKGIRILRQDPVENLISFICSANNNIPRITSMVESLCLKYGEKITESEGKSFNTFPTIQSLAGAEVENELRVLGFGYRAKYISQAANVLHEKKPPGWLQSLRKVPYEEAHAALVSIPGVGAKVADCVCLMSLDKYEAIPVDTHIWQVTVRDYMPQLKSTKTLTNKIYKEIGDFYRERFGDYAGWANTVLFAADLRKFKETAK